MALIKRNIWFLFLLITIISTIFLAILSYSHWNEVYKEHKVQNENFTKLIARTTENYFDQLNIVLTLLGKQLLENENYKNKEKSKELLSELVLINKAITAYGIMKPNGDFLLTNTNVEPEKIPNLLKREDTRETFLQALKTKELTIGRTYKLPISKVFAIPVRKTFFDKNDNPVAVVSLAIPVDNSNLFDEKILQSYSHVINLFRADLYRQLYIYKTEKEKIDDIYTKPLPKKANEYVEKQMEKTYNISRQEIEDKELTVSFEFENRVNNNKYLISTQYMKKYKLWPSSYIRYDEIVNKFLKDFFVYLMVYLVTMVIIYRLFKYIYEIEKKQKKLLEYRANHDDLTRLPNRYYLHQYFDEWTKDKDEYSLIYLDLDNFKYVNDTFGHKVGDEVIIKTSNTIKNFLNKNDLFIRQSGDEFLIFTEVTVGVEEYCKKIIENINRKFELKNKEFKIAASLGVANFPKDSKDLENLIICADIACYNAKKVRNTVKVFTQDIKDKHFETIEIEKELKTALEKNEIYLVYQPQVNYDDSLHGVETLVRWESKKLGNVRPDKFIAIAENAGLMPSIGDFILDTALKDIKKLQEKTSKDFQLSINISVKQFIEKDFYDKLMQKINLYKIEPSSVTLEVTESIFIDNIDYLTYLFINLRSKGFTISLDDFGTGYSSLSILRKLPINELKIDKAFVDDITHDISAQHMIQTIISIGKILDYHIVLAEGVETKNQVELLNKFGCDTYQGYFFSKPLVLEDLEKFIK